MTKEDIANMLGIELDIEYKAGTLMKLLKIDKNILYYWRHKLKMKTTHHYTGDEIATIYIKRHKL